MRKHNFMGTAIWIFLSKFKLKKKTFRKKGIVPIDWHKSPNFVCKLIVIFESDPFYLIPINTIFNVPQYSLLSILCANLLLVFARQEIKILQYFQGCSFILTYNRAFLLVAKLHLAWTQLLVLTALDYPVIVYIVTCQAHPVLVK